MKMSEEKSSDYASIYPSLMVTVKNEAKDRSVVAGNHLNCRPRRSKDHQQHHRPSSFQPKNVYYNSNHRYQQPQQQQQPSTQHNRPPTSSPRRPQSQYYHSYDRIHHHQPQNHHHHLHYQQQSIRPLMEIQDNLISLDLDFDLDHERNYSDIRQHEPKQRGQYRNRKAELDWDHAFDLDLIDLYSTTIDLDRHSLTSTISSSDHSFSSI